MDITILIALAATIFIIIVALALYLRQTNKPPEEVRPRGAPNRPREAVPRRAQVARNRGARLRANAAAQDVQPQESDQEDNDNDERETEALDGKLGAKKRAKLEAKAEKRAQREAEERVRQDKKQKELVDAEERRKLAEKEQAEEKRKEEEERKAKEEQERRDHEEYLKMKEAFSVEEEGFEEDESANDLNLLQQFVEYIKNNKVVVIEDLAAQFKLKTQSAIDRIRDLQKDEILTGVIDDRGKFIYISEEELKSVAKFIRQRGRITVTELAENSNKLINLTPVQ